jgi:hypothetical protein
MARLHSRRELVIAVGVGCKDAHASEGELNFYPERLARPRPVLAFLALRRRPSYAGVHGEQLRQVRLAQVQRQPGEVVAVIRQNR